MVVEEAKQQYKVIKNQRETSFVRTLTLAASLENADKKSVKFIAGQYITVFFPELGTPEGKAYSISSAPAEFKKAFTISVKAIGEFSNKLTAMKAGDTITGSLPYGFFYSESEEVPLVMIAAGIGISPFRSMTADIFNKNPGRPLTLFYSNKTAEEIVFKKYFDEVSKKHPNFKVKYFITREQTGFPNVINERINARRVLVDVPDKEHSEFLICGSISFTRDLWRDLRSVGVPEEMIYTEAFFKS